MKFLFHEMEDTVLKNYYEGEGQLVTKLINDGKTKIIKGKLAPGCTVGRHTHVTNCEVIFIISGKARMLYDDTEESLLPGDCFYCPQGHSHSFINEGVEDVLFYAVIPEHNVG